MPRKPRPDPAPTMGRPPLAGAPARKLITIRSTEEDYARWQDAAEQVGETLSDFARTSMDMRINAGIHEAPREVARK